MDFLQKKMGDKVEENFTGLKTDNFDRIFNKRNKIFL